MKNHSQHHLELNRKIKNISCDGEKSELGSKETGWIINSGVEDHLPNSNFSPADTE